MDKLKYAEIQSEKSGGDAGKLQKAARGNISSIPFKEAHLTFFAAAVLVRKMNFEPKAILDPGCFRLPTLIPFVIGYYVPATTLMLKKEGYLDTAGFGI